MRCIDTQNDKISFYKTLDAERRERAHISLIDVATSVVRSSHFNDGHRQLNYNKIIETDLELGSVKNNDRANHVAVQYTESDQNFVLGIISLFFYIGVWILSWLATPITIILFICGNYVIACIILCLILICFIAPFRPNQTFRRFCRNSLGRYFKESSVRFEHVPNPVTDRPTILCLSPHGVFSLSWAHCYLTDELHHFKWCFSTLLNLSPFFRVITKSAGYPSSVRKSTIIRHMKEKNSIAMIPGGWHEATIHNDKCDRIYIKNRQGFIAYALRYGYTITPAYAFGERMTYRNIQGCYQFRFWLNNFNILAILPWGFTWFPLFPKPVTLHVVVGKPIDLPHIPVPSSEEVKKAHDTYVQAMVDLFDRYKCQFYGPVAYNRHLEVW